jgi:large subunit ribosomal protein L10
MPKQEKIDKVATLKEQVGQASALYFLDFTGVGVNDFNATRRQLRETGASVKVVKNRLALRALTESGVGEDVGRFLRGPTSLVMAGEDPVAPVRAIKDAARKLEGLAFKGGYLDSVFYGPEQFDFLASMPNKQELRGQLVGVLSAPIAELALGLERLIGDLVYVFEQLGERKGSADAEA